MRVLFITTSLNRPGNDIGKQGAWLEDLLIPYLIFIDSGASVTVAIPSGYAIPPGFFSPPGLLIRQSPDHGGKRMPGEGFPSPVVWLNEVNGLEFDVVFLLGGQGALWDLAGNNLLTGLLEGFNNAAKPIGAVGHGVAGLLEIKDKKGELFVRGKRLTAISLSEERSSGMTNTLPFILAEKLLSLGAMYTCTTDHASYVVADGNIITGQNSASAEEVAKRIVTWYSTIKLHNDVARRQIFDQNK